MGKLADLIGERLDAAEELDKAAVPDPAEKPDEYLVFREQQRVANFKREAALKSIAEENLDYAKLSEVFKNKHSKEERRALLLELEKVISPEQEKAILENLEKNVHPLEYKDEDKVTYPLRERADELLANIPDNIKNDAQKLEEYTYALNYAKNNITKTKDDYKSELNKREMDIQRIEARMADNFINEKSKIVEGGKFYAIEEKSKFTDSRYNVAEGKEQAYEDLINAKLSFSDKTKEGVRLILQKMEEMGLEKYPYAEGGEDKGKVYGLNKINVHKLELEKAVKEGNSEDIIKYQKEYEKDLKDYKELYKIAKEHFNQQQSIHPGNLDSIRNTSLPLTLVEDVHTTAQINAMFLTYINVKTKGLNVEDYLENPVGPLVKGELKEIENTSFVKAGEGLNFEDSLKLLFKIDGFSQKSRAFEEGTKYGFGRQLSAPAVLDIDEDVRLRSGTIANIISDVAIIHLARMGNKGKFDYFTSNRLDSSAMKKAALDTMVNLMLVSDKDRDLNTLFAGEPVTDYKGKKIGEPFNSKEYLKRTPVEYEGIMSRANIAYDLLEKAKSKGKKINISTDTLLHVTQQMYMDILLAHPEDTFKPEFKKMQEEMKNTYTRLSENAKEAEKLHMEEYLKVADGVIAENYQNYLLEKKPAEYLNDLSTKAIETGKDEYYKELARALSTMEARMDKYDEATKEAIKSSKDDIFRMNDEGEYIHGLSFYQKMCHAVNELSFEDTNDFINKRDELAKKIREGEILVEPAYRDIKGNFYASTIIAADILAGDELKERLEGDKKLKNLLIRGGQEYENGEIVYYRHIMLM